MFSPILLFRVVSILRHSLRISPTNDSASQFLRVLTLGADAEGGSYLHLEKKIMHGLINYIDTRAKCLHLKKIDL